MPFSRRRPSRARTTSRRRVTRRRTTRRRTTGGRTARLVIQVVGAGSTSGSTALAAPLSLGQKSRELVRARY